MRRVMGPMLLLRFFALPAPLLLAGAPLYWAAVANLALADALSNIHSFIIIATNHCGKDMYKFENSVKPRSISPRRASEADPPPSDRGCCIVS